jgi:hypothetical protein
LFSANGFQSENTRGLSWLFWTELQPAYSKYVIKRTKIELGESARKSHVHPRMALILSSGFTVTNHNPEAINDHDFRYSDCPAVDMFLFEISTSR